MPYSSNAGKDWINRKIHKLVNPLRFLDIGVGAGSLSDHYRKLFPNSKWIGIEVWIPYVEQFNLTNKYDELIISDARWFNFNKLGNVDVVFLGDILEHMTKEEAKDIVSNALNYSLAVFISIPLGHTPQGDVGGNPYERHVVDDYTDVKVKKLFENIICSNIESLDGWTIGSYLLSSNEDIIRLMSD